MIFLILLLASTCYPMDLTQILTMSAMQGDESVDPMQIMLMTQLLKDPEENSDGTEKKGKRVL